MKNKVRQKWLSLQDWEDRYNCIAVSLIELSEFRQKYELSVEDWTDSEILDSLQAAASLAEEEYVILENKVMEAAFSLLER